MEAAQKDLSVFQSSYEDEETLTVALGAFRHGCILPPLLATEDILRCTGSQQDTPEICPVHKIWL
jgi:hypothetical protein